MTTKRKNARADFVCCDCAYFDINGPFCRRHAPAVRFSADLGRDEKWLRKNEGDEAAVNFRDAWWPMVQEDDWCGEYEKASP